MSSKIPIAYYPPQTFIKANVSQTKVVKPRKRWNQQYQLLAVQYPIQNPQPRGKKFIIRFRYKDLQNGKTKYKTVRFGDETDYVFHLDQRKKLFKYTHLSCQNDPFHPNYWKLHLLNTCSTVKQAYKRFMDQVIDNKEDITVPRKKMFLQRILDNPNDPKINQNLMEGKIIELADKHRYQISYK